MTPEKPSSERVTIIRTYDWEAAHRLPHVPDGHKCKTMHGHSYVLEVRLTGLVKWEGPEAGMVVDFGVLDAAAQELRAKVDHTTLNESLHANPTVENMAPLIWRHFYEWLVKSLPFGFMTTATLRVVLWEGPRSGCVYPPEE